MTERCFSFPQKVTNQPKTISYIARISRLIKTNGYGKVVFDFRRTTYFETNLCAVLYYLVEELESQKIKMVFWFDTVFYFRNMEALWKKFYTVFSLDSSAALFPRKLGLKEPQGSSVLLNTELSEFRLKKYETIKILLSELVANLKMHTRYGEGVCAGYHNYRNNTLVFSIVNCDITIAQQIKKARNMEFCDDSEAVLWALKKSNTTRSEDESGGLGLYLLRKFISTLRGMFHVITGDCYLKFDENCYDAKQENIIRFSEKYTLMERYEGTVITVMFPIVTKEEEEKKRELIDINLEVLGGELKNDLFN